MEIGILTWHKALNHGAVLQAYATQNYLKNNGNDALVLDYDRTVSDQRSFWTINIPRIKKVFNGELKDRKNIHQMDVEKRNKFDAFIHKYLECGQNFSEYSLKNVIIGSDMVFSLIQGYNDYMFGYGIESDNIFSYAASAGGTSIALAEKMNVKEKITAGLEKFTAVGYRDQDTQKLIEELGVKRPLCETIDPVLLYGFENEKKNWNSHGWKDKPSYILIYAYHGFMNGKNEVAAIQKYAKENHLKIISCGYYHSWCDENVNADPAEFLEMMVNANVVVTDTFHGTVFSIICQKKFVSIVRDNGFKLRYLLKKAGLINRVAQSNADIYSLLNIDVNFEECNQWLHAQRITSGQFLIGNIIK